MEPMRNAHRSVKQRSTGLDVAGRTVPRPCEPSAILVVEVLEACGLEVELIHEILAVLGMESGPLLDVNLEQLRRGAIL